MSDVSIGSYVELLPGCEEVYNSAVTGSRGYVREMVTDEYGYEKVLIEWDKDHWRYAGEPDGWTFASHFKPALAGRDLMGLDQIEIEDQPEDPCPECGEHPDLEMDIAQYVSAIEQGFNQAAESDGFYLVTMRRIFDPSINAEVIILDTARGHAIDDIGLIAESDLLRFLEEQKRWRGQ